MADMEPVTFLTTPPYSSPEGEGEGLKMVPIDDEPELVTAEQQEAAKEIAEGAAEVEAQAAKEQAEAEEAAAAESTKRAGEWVAEINAAQNQEALDAVLEQYADSGSEFKTVNDAADARQAALDAQES